MCCCSEVVAWLKAHSFVDVNVPVRLVVAAKKGDLSSGSSLRVVPDRELGLTPLMAACKCQCVEMVTELFEQGAIVHLATANGDTALHFLWREWLLPSTTTTISSNNVKGITELAVRAKSTFAILTALIAHKIDVNAQVRSLLCIDNEVQLAYQLLCVVERFWRDGAAGLRQVWARGLREAALGTRRRRICEGSTRQERRHVREGDEPRQPAPHSAQPRRH